MPKKEKGYSQVKANAKRNRKRNEAFGRQEDYDSLTVQGKIALVTARGGSKRELARLMKQKDTPVAVKSTAPVVNVEDEKPRRSRKSDVIADAKNNRPSKS